MGQQLNVFLNGGTGTITLDPEPDADGFYNSVGSVDITVDLDNGFTFVNWTKDGAELGTSTTLTYTFNRSDATIIANATGVAEADFDYGLRLYSEYVDDQNRKSRLEIEEKDYVGEPELVDVKNVRYKIGTTDNFPDEIFMKSSLNWDFQIEKDNPDLDFLLTLDPRKFRVKWYRDIVDQTVFELSEKISNAGGTMGISLQETQSIYRDIEYFGWDWLNIPTGYSGSTLFSIIGDDMIVSGGGNGSRFDEDGILQTELTNNEPRFTYNPATGLYEGVYVESIAENDISNSEGSIELDSPWGLLNCYSGTNETIYLESTNNTHPKYVSFVARRGDGEPVELTSSSGSGDVVVYVNSNSTRFIGSSMYSNTYIGDGWYFFESIIELDGSGTTFWLRNLSGNITYISLITEILGDAFYSYIATNGSPVTRPADQLTATGVVGSSSYVYYREYEGQKIAEQYYGGGLKDTFINGSYIGTTSESAFTDVVVTSTGSDKLKAVGIREGGATLSELIKLTLP